MYSHLPSLLHANKATNPGIGQNAAHCAATGGQQGVLVVLSEADPSLLEERDENGCTPMHIAAERGMLGALYFLTLRVPAVMAVRDGQGRRPVECAADEQCASFLRSREYKAKSMWSSVCCSCDRPKADHSRVGDVLLCKTQVSTVPAPSQHPHP